MSVRGCVVSDGVRTTMVLRSEKELGGGIPRHQRTVRSGNGGSGDPGDSRDAGSSGRCRADGAGDLRRWAAWLRTSTSRQVRGTLQRRRPDGTVSVCALGALGELPHTRSVLFSRATEARFMRHVVLLNDCLGWTFDEIATWLELIADEQLSLHEALRVRDPITLAAL